MSTSHDLQHAIAQLLEQEGALPIETPIIRRREKEVESDMDAGLAIQRGICIFVMPPLPTSAMQGVPFVFFDGYEIRVRIIELPALNSSGADAYELIDAVGKLMPDLPTLLMTGYDQVGDLNGTNHRVTVLRKPFERVTFLNRIEELIGALAV